MGQPDQPGLLRGRLRPARLRPGDHAVRRVRVDAQRGPAEQAGGAAAIGETSYQLGAGIGIALLGSVMNAAYAPGRVLGARGARRRPSSAAATRWARRTRSPPSWAGRPGPRCGTRPGTSFVHGLHVTLLVSAGLLLLGAVIALRLPRTMECAPADGATRRLLCPAGAADAPLLRGRPRTPRHRRARGHADSAAPRPGRRRRRRVPERDPCRAARLIHTVWTAGVTRP